MVRGHDALSLTTWSAVVLGAVCSAGLAGSIDGGWEKGIPGSVAWAVLPYAVLSISFALGRVFRAGRPVQLLLVWATVAVAFGGPLLYIDAMLARADAQGALAALMIPIRQTAAVLVADAIAVIWQWTEPS